MNALCLFWGGLPRARTIAVLARSCPNKQRPPPPPPHNRFSSAAAYSFWFCLTTDRRCDARAMCPMTIYQALKQVSLTRVLRSDYKSKEYLIYFPRIPNIPIGMQIERVIKDRLGRARAFRRCVG